MKIIKKNKNNDIVFPTPINWDENKEYIIFQFNYLGDNTNSFFQTYFINDDKYIVTGIDEPNELTLNKGQVIIKLYQTNEMIDDNTISINEIESNENIIYIDEYFGEIKGDDIQDDYITYDNNDNNITYEVYEG